MSRSVGTPPLVLSAQEVRQRALLRYADDGLVLLDRSGEVIEVGPSYPRVLGYAPEKRCKMRTAEMIHPDDLDSWHQAWAELMARPGGTSALVLRARHGDGRWCSLDLTFHNGLDDPDVQGVVATVRNLSKRHGGETRRSGQQGVFEDLPDRQDLLGRLTEAVAGLRAYSQVLVLVVKLDQLHLVARACGRDQAAQLLAAAARRLRRDLRTCDDLGVLGDDRLVVICETHTGKREANGLAKRVAACFSEPFRIEDDQVVLTASIGIALAIDPGADASALLEDADLAMASASTAGGNRRVFFSPAERADAISRVTLPAALRQALADNEFVVHYQPVVELSTGRTVGAEALVRWAHADGTLAGPDSFIGAAEASGVIGALGAWVLQEACETALRWPAGPGGPAYVAVNLSAHQLEDPGLPAVVRKVLSGTGLGPSRLTLEVTESVLVVDPEAAIRRLRALRDLGVKIAIDDFGTGYSSLSYLKALPADVLKIDRTFVAGLGTDPADAAIVGAVLALAEALGLDVVAEGVETDTQAAELRRLGCSHAQGYLFGRPCPADRLVGSLLCPGSDTATDTGS